MVELQHSLGDSTCGLSQIFGNITAKVPDGPPGNAQFVFHADVLPEPPPRISTDRILFRKCMHDYNGWYRAESLWMYLSPQKCRELGVFLLACCFHGPKGAVTLSITHPDSEIRRIVVPASPLRMDDLPPGLSTAPFAFRYFPTETAKHPWIDNYDVCDLPVLALSNAEDLAGSTEEDWNNRDTIWLVAQQGTFNLAELLLNAGCSWNPVREYELEGDAGFRGVGRMSAELNIFLPGSHGWIFSAEDDIPKRVGR